VLCPSQLRASSLSGTLSILREDGSHTSCWRSSTSAQSWRATRRLVCVSDRRLGRRGRGNGYFQAVTVGARHRSRRPRSPSGSERECAVRGTREGLQAIAGLWRWSERQHGLRQAGTNEPRWQAIRCRRARSWPSTSLARCWSAMACAFPARERCASAGRGGRRGVSSASAGRSSQARRAGATSSLTESVGVASAQRRREVEERLGGIVLWSTGACPASRRLRPLTRDRTTGLRLESVGGSARFEALGLAAGSPGALDEDAARSLLPKPWVGTA